MERSRILFDRAQKVIPGGVNSPVRACKSVGVDPVFIASAKGAHLTDVDGKEYIDYVMSWGPMLLGPAHPAVIQAVERQLQLGTNFIPIQVRHADIEQNEIEGYSFGG